MEAVAICQSEQFCRYQECPGTGFAGEFGGDWVECLLGIGAG